MFKFNGKLDTVVTTVFNAVELISRVFVVKRGESVINVPEPKWRTNITKQRQFSFAWFSDDDAIIAPQIRQARVEEGYSLIWPILRMCRRTGYGFRPLCPKQRIQFCTSLSQTGYTISRKSALNSDLCESACTFKKQCNDCNMISQLQLPINGCKATRRAFCPLS